MRSWLKLVAHCPLPRLAHRGSRLALSMLWSFIYLKHDAFKKGLAPATQAMRRPILDHFREFLTPSGRRYGENRLATIQRKNINDVLAGKTSNAQRNWLKVLRHLIAFAIQEGECSVESVGNQAAARDKERRSHDLE